MTASTELAPEPQVTQPTAAERYAEFAARRTAAVQHATEAEARAVEFAPIADALRARYIDGDPEVTRDLIDAAELDARHAALDAGAARRASERLMADEPTYSWAAVAEANLEDALTDPAVALEAALAGAAPAIREAFAALDEALAPALAAARAHDGALTGLHSYLTAGGYSDPEAHWLRATVPAEWAARIRPPAQAEGRPPASSSTADLPHPSRQEPAA
ncbi:hypothetical protein GCM10027449_26360 [Sinomonas notoginsengisoli]|uniref:hypothetical protein n=1 Tax=Sinomonas notoginsengisoli TaxID=1457311 RepID=UPI001F352F21|nr:hypothetical protein [Sinomonas notoginsengisoli]